MSSSNETMPQAADALRAWALNEDLKATVMADPTLAALAARVARRYTAGHGVDDALLLLAENAQRGHLGSIELMGESIREEPVVVRETDAILDLIQRLTLSGESATISLDLSHIGSVVSPHLGLSNARRIAQAARGAGTSLMISAESSERTDLVLDLWEQLSGDFPETGITVQARLYRTPSDLQRVIARPGPVRVVKGAFLESPEVAAPRDSPAMYAAYRDLVAQLVRSGHRTNVATHDAHLVHQLRGDLGEDLRGDHVEFEMLQGLGTTLLDSLHHEGFTTREYIVYGPEWWLYVLNRIAEHPERVFAAIVDLGPTSPGP